MSLDCERQRKFSDLLNSKGVLTITYGAELFATILLFQLDNAGIDDWILYCEGVSKPLPDGLQSERERDMGEKQPRHCLKQVRDVLSFRCPCRTPVIPGGSIRHLRLGAGGGLFCPCDTPH